MHILLLPLLCNIYQTFSPRRIQWRGPMAPHTCALNVIRVYNTRAYVTAADFGNDRFLLVHYCIHVNGNVVKINSRGSRLWVTRECCMGTRWPPPTPYTACRVYARGPNTRAVARASAAHSSYVFRTHTRPAAAAR